jgi:hypothetical protein
VREYCNRAADWSSWILFNSATSQTMMSYWSSSRQSYHEPYYLSYLNEDFAALAARCGLVHVRNVSAFISKVMVFDKRP